MPETDPIKIFVVIHSTFENTNVFFTDKAAAIKYMEEVIPVKYPDERSEQWEIREITEGEEFGGDLGIY
jgi:hypothetical protein